MIAYLPCSRDMTVYMSELPLSRRDFSSISGPVVVKKAVVVFIAGVSVVLIVSVLRPFI